MPIYEYQCTDCDKGHEAIQKMSDAPLTDCPHCGTNGLKKKISVSGFRLGGSGWYETDFKTGEKRNIADKSADNPPPSCGSGACPSCE